jgi:mannose-1-phosphate guanylyltransferase/mannose-6-phosphate isomerase
MIPVVLSGGSGTRMWPQSRSMHPKQLLPLLTDKSMLQDTIGRLSGLKSIRPPIVVCNEDHRFLVSEQLREINIQAQSVVLEPIGRNTAPAIALAAFTAPDPSEVLLVLPADHVISDIPAFSKAIEVALVQAKIGALVTFGINPTKPETGYGYIKSGAPVDDSTFQVEKFVEKPDLHTATKYLESGGYSWNSGMFMFRADAYLTELEKYQPSMFKHCKQAVEKATYDLDFTRIDQACFEQCINESVDHAVMEKTQNAVVVPVDIGWNDVGSWAALWEESSKDEDGNSLTGDIIVEDTKNCFIRSEGKLIASLGVENIVLVETDDSILLASKDSVQKIKSIVAKLKKDSRPEVEIHRKVFRPWGYYDSSESGKNFQVKRLAVYPGAQLSLQKHQHRAEHWVVVSGVADVVNGDQTIKLHVNESTYIPIGAVHQLGNSSDELLEIIEVQSGEYLGEDDIERIEDVYGRA